MSDKQLYIRYHKWTRDEFRRLAKSLNEIMSMSSFQFYMPLFSLYFYIHNTSRSHQTIDFERRYYLQEWLDTTKERYYNSNLLGNALIYDSGRHLSEIKPIFCKMIPILDPIHCINNNYNLISNHNHYLPSGYNYNTFNKINDMNNNAYIDVFCSYLFGQLTQTKKNPSFPLFYGSLNGTGEYKFDITEEYHDLKMDKCFNENLGKGFTLDMYVSDSESDDSEIEDIPRSDTESDSSKDDKYHDDYIAIFKKLPIQLLFIEQLEKTLEDYLISDEYDEKSLIGCLFQVTFALTYLQRRYQFTHNDLHINNVMFTNTETKYLYYKLNNQYFRIPTNGKIVKIIDFGRAIFTFKNKRYMNDVFSRNGEAGGQYSYPHQVSFLDHGDSEWKPNYHFDLCRLSMTILEEIQQDKTSEETLDFLKTMCMDRQNKSFCDMKDDFSLYVAIARNACQSLPREILEHPIFKQFRISKKHFPRKSYYGL